MSLGKLLFVAPSAYPLGGVQVWLDYILPGLRELGWIVELALTAGRHHDVDAYLAKHPFAPTYRVAAPTGTQFGRIQALKECFIAASPDIVVGVNIADVYAAVAAANAKTTRRMKAVATLHGLQPDFLGDFATHSRILDAVISTNRLAQRLVQVYGGVGVDRALYAPYGVEGEERPSRRDGAPFRLAYVGRIENDQKRTDDLVSLLVLARDSGLDIELVVAGAGPDELALRRRVKEALLEDRIRFLGVLTPSETQETVYLDCDALIVTSSWETGPIVAWEAMTLGVPILTSAYLGSGAEGALIHGENCLMFPIGDMRTAFDQLQLLLRPDVRHRIVENGRKLVLRRFTRAASIAQWHEQLSSVRNMPARAAAGLTAATRGGRLDRVLGARAAEALRLVARRHYRHAEAGGEWPHAYGLNSMSDVGFWKEATRLDVALA